MDNFDKLDEPLISSSERKRKIKAEMFSQNPAKAARYNGEGKTASCIDVNHNNQAFVRRRHCQRRRLQRLKVFLNVNVELSAFAKK